MNESQQGTLSKVSALWRTLPSLIRTAEVHATLRGSNPQACVVTGLGGSEWPSRVFEWLMRSRGKACEFVPLSRFVTDAPAADTLVVFSQYLSNNVAFALRAAKNYHRVLIVSALDDVCCRERLAALGVALPTFEWVTVPTPDERSFLFRPVGPALMATVGVSRVLESWGLDALPLAAIADAYEYAEQVNNIDHVSNAVLSLGRDSGVAAALAWKANEALGQPVPSWDAVGFAHGGFQAIFEAPTFEALLLLPETTCGRMIESGVRSMLGPRHHTVRTFTSKENGLPAPFAYDATFTPYLLARLESTGRDLEAWPGKGCDGAMYNLTKLDRDAP